MFKNETIQLLLSKILPNLCMIVQSDSNKTLLIWINYLDNNIAQIGHTVVESTIFQEAFDLYYEELSCENAEFVVIESTIHPTNLVNDAV